MISCDCYEHLSSLADTFPSDKKRVWLNGLLFHSRVLIRMFSPRGGKTH